MRIAFATLIFSALAALLAMFGCRPTPYSTSSAGRGSIVSASPIAAAEQPSPASTGIDAGEILGIVPESEPDLPPGTAVWIRSGDKLHSLLEIVQMARRRIASEEKSPPDAAAHVQIVLSPKSKEAFAEVMIGSGVGTPHWVVVLDEKLKITSYRKLVSRD